MNTCKVVLGIQKGAGWELGPSGMGDGVIGTHTPYNLFLWVICQHCLDYPVDGRNCYGEIK